VIFYDLFRDDPRMLALRAGTELFHQGEASDLMYVLVKGEALVKVGQREVERLEPGAVVGEMALIDKGPRSATVQAVTDCEFCCIDEKRFKFLVTETPGFAISVMRVLSDRLRIADSMIE